MKCPKCGFVSYAGLELCKKCGYPFVKGAPKGPSSSITSLFPGGVRSIARPAGKPSTAPSNAGFDRDLTTQATAAFDTVLEPQKPPTQNQLLADGGRAEQPSANWREELSERVVSFRKKRARLQTDSEAEENLELEFDNSDKLDEIASVQKVPGSSKAEISDFDMEIGQATDAAQLEGDPAIDALSFEESGGEGMEELDAAPEDTGEMSLGEPTTKSAPMEILVGSPTESAPEEGMAEIFLAPLGRRCAAGLLDAGVLALGAALFACIFWYFCRHLTPAPFNVAILGLAAAILIFAYFAVFTAIASATPGLLWMGCEIRNLHGGRPTVAESAWRAFGVLVSLSALALGFIWACVDSDTLTWHDRMSGTAITEERVASDVAGLDVAT